MSPKTPHIWRRLHVFLAVALAVFLLGLAAVGAVEHGFRMAPTTDTKTTATEPATTQSNETLDTVAKQYKVARETTVASLQRYETANVELQGFLDNHFADLARSVEQPNRGSTSVASAPPSIGALPAPAVQMIANPRWQELNETLIALKNRRVELLTKLQPDHPAVQDIDLSIADAKAQMVGVPKDIRDELIAAPSPQRQQGQSPLDPAVQQVPGPSPAITPEMLSTWRAADSEYRRLASNVTAAQTECRADMNQQNILWRQKTQAEADHSATLAIAAFKSANVGADLRYSIFGCGLLAIVLGGIVAMRARRSEAVFRAAAQVRQHLGLTVLGLLPYGPHQSVRETPLCEPRWIRSSVLAAELCLVAIVVVLAVASLVDRQFFFSLLANPLAACSQKFFC